MDDLGGVFPPLKETPHIHVDTRYPKNIHPDWLKHGRPPKNPPFKETPIGVPPKHPKMIIFSRKTHGCWVPLFLETPI